MNETIPAKVIRNIIADILFERANCIDDIADEKVKYEEETIGYYTESTGEIGWTACGTRVLSDDVREGIMPIKEALNVLMPIEKKEAKRRCLDYLKENKRGEIERN